MEEEGVEGGRGWHMCTTVYFLVLCKRHWFNIRSRSRGRTVGTWESLCIDSDAGYAVLLLYF